MTNTADVLQAWRLNWQPDEFEWRSLTWENRADLNREEREQRKRERSRRDRLSFGERLWGVGKAHRSAELNAERLARYRLPAFANERALAEWLGISLKRLRWYTYDRKVSPIYHYTRYTLPKRGGGQRVILAPKRTLKAIQHKILFELLAKVPNTDAAHGFIKGRSIATNAAPHVGKACVLNLDLKDFFPSITYPRVRGLFVALGYGFTLASVLALLCTESERIGVQRGDKTRYVAINARHLVQGAPTSPAIANLMARRLDARLHGLAAQKGAAYTRYADDLTFSAGSAEVATQLLRAAKRIIADEGLTLHMGKIRFFRQSARQMVTGLVVNEKVSVPRDVRRRVRAILHRATHSGLAAQNREGRQHFRAYLHGLIGHIALRHPEQAAQMLAELREIRD